MALNDQVRMMLHSKVEWLLRDCEARVAKAPKLLEIGQITFSDPSSELLDEEHSTRLLSSTRLSLCRTKGAIYWRGAWTLR